MDASLSFRCLLTPLYADNDAYAVAVNNPCNEEKLGPDWLLYILESFFNLFW